MKFAIIIPARFASTRYPGKPLAMLHGAGGAAKPLVQRSWDCARQVAGASGVWVATDDERIADAVRGFGGQVVMTGDRKARVAVSPLLARCVFLSAPLTRHC